MVNTLGFLRESRTFYSVCCCSWRSNISETSSDSTGIVISVFWLSLFGTNNYHYSFNFWTLWSFAPIIFNNRQSSTYFHGSVFRDGIACLMHCKKAFLSILMGKNLSFHSVLHSVYFGPLFLLKISNWSITILFPHPWFVLPIWTLELSYLVRRLETTLLHVI